MSRTPWLKSFYEGAKRIPGYDEALFTPSEDVDRFDVANFDKPSADVLKQAEMIVAERKAREATAKAEKEITETRNQKRKEYDKQTEAEQSYDDGGYSLQSKAPKAITQRHEIKEREKNGFKVGEKVWYTRADGKGKRELATIVDFGGGSDVVLDTGMAPVMYEGCEWSLIAKREPDIFDKAAEVADRVTAKREGAKKIAQSRTAGLNHFNPFDPERRHKSKHFH